MDLQFGDVIGEGSFGVVRKAFWRSHSSSSSSYSSASSSACSSASSSSDPSPGDGSKGLSAGASSRHSNAVVSTCGVKPFATCGVPVAVKELKNAMGDRMRLASFRFTDMCAEEREKERREEERRARDEVLNETMVMQRVR
jgi:hypothetical protein